MAGSVLVDAVEELVEQLGSLGLVVFDGVVALAEQHGLELEAGLVVGAGLADRLEDAVEFGGSGAVAVAEQPLVGLDAELAHLASLGAGRQDRRRVVERLNLFGD